MNSSKIVPKVEEFKKFEFSFSGTIKGSFVIIAKSKAEAVNRMNTGNYDVKLVNEEKIEVEQLVFQ